MEQLSRSLSPVFNSSRSASPWAPGTEGHCDNPSLSFGVDQERRNSMGSVVPHAHPPPTHCAQDMEPHAHRSLRGHRALPAPRLHSEQIKKALASPAAFWRVHPQSSPGQTEGGPWVDGLGISFPSCGPPRAQAVLATPVRLASHALPTAALHV